jgi:hypothetical protein
MSGTIEADDEPSRAAQVLVPGATADGQVSGSAEEGGIVSRVAASLTSQAGILRQSSHPLVLALLYLFRSAAITVYVLCGICASLNEQADDQSPITMS